MCAEILRYKRGEPGTMATATEKVQENGEVNGAREVTTICGFCGVGCGLTLKVEDGIIQKVTGEIKAEHGPYAFGTFSSSRSTNELNYLAGKFVRQVLGNSNIDSCNRA